MTLDDQYAPGSQVRAAFCSEARFSHWADPRSAELEVARILHPAPPNAYLKQIGGIFHAGNRYYLQVIEGPSPAVDWYLQHSEADERHQNFKALGAWPVDSPAFKLGHLRFVGKQDDMHAIQQQAGERVFNPYRYDESMINAFVELAVDVSAR